MKIADFSPIFGIFCLSFGSLSNFLEWIHMVLSCLSKLFLILPLLCNLMKTVRSNSRPLQLKFSLKGHLSQTNQTVCGVQTVEFCIIKNLMGLFSCSAPSNIILTLSIYFKSINKNKLFNLHSIKLPMLNLVFLDPVQSIEKMQSLLKLL